MIYPSTAIADLEQLIDHCQPNDLLCVGNEIVMSSSPNQEPKPYTLATEFCLQRDQLLKPCNLTQLEANCDIGDKEFTYRYDLAVISATFENIEKRSAEQLLSRLRNLCAPKVAVLISFSHSTWQPSDLLAFGLVRVAHYAFSSANNSEESLYGLYHYNIETYKHTPDWLNSKHWANPELWDKTWW